MKYNQIGCQLRKLALLVTALLTLAGISLNVNAADKSAKIAWAKIDDGAVLIDVRTPEEFAQGHLKNAINIPFEYILQGVNHFKIDKETPIVVYCRSGRRSGIANKDLIQAGFSNSYNGGGFIPLSQHRQSSVLTN